MSDVANDSWNSDAGECLAKVLSAIDDPKVMRQFLDDVLTKKEISEISARLRAASMLQDGATYAQVIAKTRLSSRTVARVSNWLHNGTGGFLTALEVIRAMKKR